MASGKGAEPTRRRVDRAEGKEERNGRPAVEINVNQMTQMRQYRFQLLRRSNANCVIEEDGFPNPEVASFVYIGFIDPGIIIYTKYCASLVVATNPYKKKKKKKPVLTVYFQKWANAGRCWAADQHLLRSYKRFECNRDLKLSEVRCLEYRRSFTTRRAIFTSSSRSRRQFLTQHPPHGLVVASP